MDLRFGRKFEQQQQQLQQQQQQQLQQQPVFAVFSNRKWQQRFLPEVATVFSRSKL
jgi:hypothetical protein